MTIYISGPITKDPDFRDKFGRMEAKLSNKGYDVLNPAKLSDVYPKGFTYDDMMDISFQLLSRCEAVMMLNGWMESAGACMEYGYAIATDKLVLKEDYPI